MPWAARKSVKSSRRLFRASTKHDVLHNVLLVNNLFSIAEYLQKKIATSELAIYIINFITGTGFLSMRVEKGHNTIEVSLCSGQITKTRLGKNIR